MKLASASESTSNALNVVAGVSALTYLELTELGEALMVRIEMILAGSMAEELISADDASSLLPLSCVDKSVAVYVLAAAENAILLLPPDGAAKLGSMFVVGVTEDASALMPSGTVAKLRSALVSWVAPALEIASFETPLLNRSGFVVSVGNAVRDGCELLEPRACDAIDAVL